MIKVTKSIVLCCITLIFFSVALISAETIYEYHNTEEDEGLAGIYPIYWPGQTFTVGTVGPNEDFDISQVRVKVYSRGSPGICYFSIRETSNGFPIGLDLSLGSLDGNSVTADTSGEWYSIDMTPYTLKASTQYGLVAGCPSGSEDDVNSIRWVRDNDDGYSGGTQVLSVDSGLTWWHIYPSNDFMFEILGTPAIKDSDNDGVIDDEDKCSGTMTEQVIYGCSCEQILELKPGEDTRENQEGCSKGIIDVFTKDIGWAKDLF